MDTVFLQKTKKSGREYCVSFVLICIWLFCTVSFICIICAYVHTHIELHEVSIFEIITFLLVDYFNGKTRKKNRWCASSDISSKRN